jgi:toxoflavin biosynthesis protein ToxD
VFALSASPPPDRTRPVASAARGVPPLDACVLLPAGSYGLGDAGERVVALEAVRFGRWPVTSAHMREFVADTGRRVSDALERQLDAGQLADHPVTQVTFGDAADFTSWASHRSGKAVRLPTGDEWEAAARGFEHRIWPWGDVFDPERCNTVESAWGWTVPVRAHPAGAAAGGAEQLAGNVWEWVGDEPDGDGWRVVRGGSYLDAAWGVRAARALPTDPQRATPTTGFRVVIEGDD